MPDRRPPHPIIPPSVMERKGLLSMQWLERKACTLGLLLTICIQTTDGVQRQACHAMPPFRFPRSRQDRLPCKHVENIWRRRRILFSRKEASMAGKFSLRQLCRRGLVWVATSCKKGFSRQFFQ